MSDSLTYHSWFAGCRGLAVTCLTAVWEDQGLNPIMGSCMFILKTVTIYSLGHGLHTLTAVPRSTQPSTLRGMVKWVSAFGLSNNNKWGWWVWLLAAYRRTHSPGHLAWSEGRRSLGAVPYSAYEPWALAVALSYDDSTINIVVVVIIIIIIIAVDVERHCQSKIAISTWNFLPASLKIRLPILKWKGDHDHDMRAMSMVLWQCHSHCESSALSPDKCQVATDPLILATNLDLASSIARWVLGA